MPLQKIDFFNDKHLISHLLHSFVSSLPLERVMKEFIKKCFSLSIFWQVTPMPAQELFCLSLASCCLPSNCLQAMADGLWSCLSPVQGISTLLWPPGQATPAEQAAGNGGKSQ